MAWGWSPAGLKSETIRKGTPSGARGDWRSRYIRILVLLDGVVGIAAVGVGLLAQNHRW